MMFLAALLWTCFGIQIIAFVSVSSSVSTLAKVAEGVPVNFTCRQNEQDQPSFVWYLDGRLIGPNEASSMLYPFVTTGGKGARIVSSSVEITPHLNQNGSLLRCLVSGSVTRREEWMLDVFAFEQPSIDESDCNGTLIEDRVCTFACHANYQPDDVKWYLNGKRLQQDDATSTSDGTTSVIHFIPRRWHHRLVLRCEAPFIGMVPWAEVVLEVLYQPFIERSGETSEKPNTTLWCEIDANPPANISWFGPSNTNILTVDRILTTHLKNESGQVLGTHTVSQLTLDQTNASRGGVYKCFAYNAQGTTEASIELPRPKRKLQFYIVGVPLLMIGLCCILLAIAAVCAHSKLSTKKAGEDECTYDTANLEGSRGLTRWLTSTLSRRFKQRPAKQSAPKSGDRKTVDISKRRRLSLPRVF